MSKEIRHKNLNGKSFCGWFPKWYWSIKEASWGYVNCSKCLKKKEQLMKIPMFNDVIKEFYGFVGDISSSRIYSFELQLRKALRDAYKQGYKDLEKKLVEEQDIFDDAG